MVATLIKEARMAKGFTQKELSDLSNVSIRSIQRIENAELIPRSYTLKTLASVLGLPFESFQTERVKEETVRTGSAGRNAGHKAILSAGLALSIILLAAAFLAQSPTFPETHFEFFIFALLTVAIITSVLLLIWRK